MMIKLLSEIKKFMTTIFIYLDLLYRLLYVLDIKVHMVSLSTWIKKHTHLLKKEIGGIL
jgi:hypothetical protein